MKNTNPYVYYAVCRHDATSTSSGRGTISMTSHGQYFAQSLQPIQISVSTQTTAFTNSFACAVANSGPGTLYMQSTGQTSIQTSHPVQPSSCTTAMILDFFFFGGAFGAFAIGASTVSAIMIMCYRFNTVEFESDGSTRKWASVLIFILKIIVPMGNANVVCVSALSSPNQTEPVHHNQKSYVSYLSSELRKIILYSFNERGGKKIPSRRISRIFFLDARSVYTTLQDYENEPHPVRERTYTSTQWK